MRTLCSMSDFAAALAAAGAGRAGEPIFVPEKIDGPLDAPALHSYWFGPFCECASVADLDGDGDRDVVAAGKGGLCVLRQRGRTPEGKPAMRLPPESSYPSWVPWNR